MLGSTNDNGPQTGTYLKGLVMNGVTEFTHTRNKDQAESVSTITGRPVSETGSERFKGEVWSTPLGIIVSTFDGENQHMMIVNGDQSGMGEVLLVDSPVDSPMKVEHVICRGRTREQVIVGVYTDRPGVLNPHIDAFMLSIPPEAQEIVKADRRWEWTRFE